MEKYRCERFRELEAWHDNVIRIASEKAVTRESDRTAQAHAADVKPAKRAKARELHIHMKRCPLCR